MIAFVKGNYITKLPSRVVVDVNGVGYDVQISLNTFEVINKQDAGLLHTYLHITENAQILFGFADLEEKNLFLHLISVSGIGATTARMMLSGMKPQEIVKVIVQGSVLELMRIKGIGKKSAEMLVVSLRDKLANIANDNILSSLSSRTIDADAVEALISLGIGKSIAEKAVQKAVHTETDMSLEQLIKAALKNL